MTLKLEPFHFAVYDGNCSRHTVTSTGLYLEQRGHPWWSSMWVRCGHDVPNLRADRTVVSCPHLPAHVELDFTDQTDLPNQMGAVFCAFIQGVVLGWKTVKRDFKVLRGEPRDNVNIADYVPEPDRPNLGERLGVGIRQWRVLCRADVLAFAVKEYEEKGATHMWSIDDFQESGFARLPYPVTTIRGVVSDLSQESVLGGTFGPMCVLDPQEYRRGIRAQVDESLQQWVEHVRSVGEKEGWLVQMAEPSKADGPGETVGVVPKVFIIHGHDEAKRRELKDLLTGDFGLDVVIMQEKPGRSRTLIEKFEQEAVNCNAAIAVMTPDDIVDAANGSRGQPRANVVYELGWFAGKFGRARTLMVVRKGTLIPSDLEGIQRIEFRENISEQMRELKSEIEEWKHPRE